MKRIFFNEVARRDGFQIEPQFIPTDDKIALIDALSDCGYARIAAEWRSRLLAGRGCEGHDQRQTLRVRYRRFAAIISPQLR
jgi:isopropylmalate/homocitrate/citramalate synthase